MKADIYSLGRGGWLALSASAALVLFAASAVGSDLQPATFRGQPYGDVATSSPARDNAQSKVWYNDAAWWAVMLDHTDGHIRIHELRDNQAWWATEALIDERADSTADVLWEQGKLFVVSRTPTGPIRVVSFLYDSSRREYIRRSGFPVVVSQAGTQSASIARDTTDRLWVTYTADRQVWLAHTTTSDHLHWTEPYEPPVSDTRVASDDISTLVSFDERVGLMWSNQRSHALRFAIHQDGNLDDDWSLETPIAGTDMADDHINIKSDADGRVYAAVKTSQDEIRGQPESPLVVLLVRSVDGNWGQRTFGTVAENHTRPVVIVDASHRHLYLLATAPVSGGVVYYKRTSVSDISFEPGLGDPFVARPGTTLNDVSGAKHPVTAESGIVVIATSGVTDRRYYHTELALRLVPAPGPIRPVPGGEPLTGERQLAVILEFALVSLVLAVSIWMLVQFRGSAFVQAAIAFLVGLVATFIILGDRLDLVPDGMEHPVGVAVLVGVVALVFLLRRAARSA